MMRKLLLLAAGMLLCATPAAAALKICNRTSYVLYAATASVQAGEVQLQGWTRLVPGGCQVPIESELSATQYFVYAKSSLAHSGMARAWGGTTLFCVKDSNFSLHLPLAVARCPGDDSFARPFARLDTHHMRSWTLTFDDAPPEASMIAAAKDGLQRLLRDNGFATGDPNAMARFRQRLHISAKASDAQLFDALETEALKGATPAGYTVCNDSAGLVLVALGQKMAAGWLARGWWKIAAGSCAKALSEALATDKIYLLAQKPNGGVLVGGAEKFCVTAAEFEVRGRERCAARGLSEAGFAATDVRGVSGYVVHIGAGGLVSHPGAISK